MPNVGRISISDAVILDLLDLRGGKILAVALQPHSEVCEFIIEHPDMPQMGDWPKKVELVYTREEDSMGRYIIRRLRKKEEEKNG